MRKQAYNPPDFLNISLGDVFYSKLLKNQAEVVGLDQRKKKVQIKCKNITLWCPPESLGVLEKKDLTSQEITIRVKAEVSGKIEIDGRGMRLEEFQSIVEKSLDELLREDIPFLKIIHGHGEGILKKWLREYLKNNPDFKSGPDEGNDGITRVDLRRV